MRGNGRGGTDFEFLIADQHQTTEGGNEDRGEAREAKAVESIFGARVPEEGAEAVPAVLCAGGCPQCSEAELLCNEFEQFTARTDDTGLD